MHIKTIKKDWEIDSQLAGNLIDHAMIDDAVDISVLTSFEEERVIGEPDLVVELIDIYCDDAPQKLKLLKTAVAVGDTNSLRRVAHSLKGSSSSLGAGQMAVLCDEIETGAGDLSPLAVNILLNKLDNEFELVRLAFATERHRRLSC